MDISFLPYLQPKTDLYVERFAAFEANTNQRQTVSEWINERFDDEVTSQLLESLDENVTLSALGVGCGDGQHDVDMLTRLVKKFPSIEYTVVEPSNQRMSSFKTRVKERKDVLNGVTFIWREETLQDFCTAIANFQGKFHFASAIHSLYYVTKQDFDEYLNPIIGRTEGKILIVNASEENCLHQMQKHFPGVAHEFRPSITAEDLTDYIKKLGISFKTTDLTSGECDVTDCFDDQSSSGKHLLDFLLQVVDCRDNAPPELLKMITDFLGAISYRKNGRLYAPIAPKVILLSV